MVGWRLVVAILVLAGVGIGAWKLLDSSPPQPPAPARDAAITHDATLRHAPTAPAVRPDAAPVIEPPASGGFAAWTGYEGSQPGELEAGAEAQHVPLDVARESRRLMWLVELSRHRQRIAELSGHELDDDAWNALVRAGNDAQRSGMMVLDDLRAGSVEAAPTLAQLRGIEAEYRTDFERRTGLSDAQFELLFVHRDLRAPRVGVTRRRSRRAVAD
jgi:hypothetical protein